MRRSRIAALWIFAPALALADADNVGVPDSAVELGLGWNSQLARVVANRFVEFAPVQERGQTLNMTMTEVSDTSDVMESLNVSAGMNIRSIFGSGSAQAEFATTSNVNSSSNSLLIRATVSNGVLFAGPSRPLVPARNAYPEVSVGATGDVTAGMSSEDKSEVANTQLEVTYTQIGGAGGIIPTEKAAFINKLETLPLEAEQGPQFHTMDVTPYSDIANWPQRIALDTRDDPVEAALGNYYWTFTSLAGSIEEILSDPSRY